LEEPEKVNKHPQKTKQFSLFYLPKSLRVESSQLLNNMEFIQKMFDPTSTAGIVNIVCYSLFILWGVFSFKWIRTMKAEHNPDAINPYLYESIPSVFTTLGILGTFIGIFVGLQNFDVNKITESIPTLLDGLKTAFSTSIVGIVLSFIFGRWSQRVLNRVEKESATAVNNELSALHEIIKLLKDSKAEANQNSQTLNKSLVGDTAESISTQLTTLKNQISDNQRNQENEIALLNKIHSALGGDDDTSLLIQIQKLRAEQNDYSKETKKHIEFIVKSISDNQRNQENEIALLNKIHSALGGDEDTSLLIQIQKLRAEQNDYSKETKKHIEFIVKSMNDNNLLISKKFDEFSDLLAKNNTEALVNVMRQATDEFNKQMTAIVEKLVQENFQELNNSVQRMNQWQQENKEMIIQLTAQFTKVSEDFSISSNAMKEITINTTKLTDENSHLSQLIQALQKVMIDDTKYQEIVVKLTDAIDTLKDNTDAFDETTGKLNNWVKNQMNFSDSVAKLLTRLEGIEKIKDINEEFWNNTKKQMNDGVNVIANASKMLSNDLENINDEFYGRLNDTLQNLDTLIQRIITKYKK
jgi:biopolymer transport protein ExbB/TolQ